MKFLANVWLSINECACIYDMLWNSSLDLLLFGPILLLFDIVRRELMIEGLTS